MTTLVSFLGKGRNDPRTGYRTARYRFDDAVREVPYFGLALAERLRPRRLILVGTAGSMWDVFFEQQGAPDEALLPLIDAVAGQNVDEDLLAQHEKRLAEKLGCPVECLLIPYARDAGEQIAVLERLSGAIRSREPVVLDVTHAFRHLPLIALVAARYLSHVAQVEVEAIYYGALEMTPPNGDTPVLRLDGLLRLLDWVEALATYDKDGDYGVFAPLLEKDGLAADKARSLRRAAFFERSSNPVKAKEAIGSVFPAIETHAGSLAALFKESLKRRIAWFRGEKRHDWELALADAYLARRDYVRAAIFLYEAFVSRAAWQQERDHNDYRQREEAWQAARQGNKAARKLEYLRNALTHGIRPDDDEVARWVRDENALAGKLEEFRRALFE